MMSPLTDNVLRRIGCGACLAVIAAALLCACAVGPDFVRPAPPSADRYTSKQQTGTTLAVDGQAQRFKSDTAVATDWWRLFKSAQLDAMGTAWASAWSR